MCLFIWGEEKVKHTHAVKQGGGREAEDEAMLHDLLELGDKGEHERMRWL